jgi:succinyl-diaminopimelate desuccinylase
MLCPLLGSRPRYAGDRLRREPQRNVEALKGFTPIPIVSLGGTDARLWRYRNIPAYVYGPFPRGMGSTDEHVEIEEFLHIARVHVLSAYDYLMRQ